MSDLSWYKRDEIEDVPAFAAVPKGRHLSVLASIEERDNSKGNGRHLNACFQVIEGPHKDRKMFHIFNVKHDDDATRASGQAAFKRFCDAIGEMTPTFASILEKPLFVEVKAVEVWNNKERSVIDDHGFQPATGEAVKTGGTPARDPNKKPWQK
jgi:hypothetical protein